MRKILIVCGSGITSSLIAQDVNTILKDEYYVLNTNISMAMKEYQYFDMVFVAPQVKFLYKNIVHLCDKEHIPCILLNFDEYTTGFILTQIKKAHFSHAQPLTITFVKDDQSGQLALLYVNKLKQGLINNKIEVNIEIVKYSEYIDHGQLSLFEPKLMFLIKQDKNHIIIRSSDYHTLNVEPMIKHILCES